MSPEVAEHRIALSRRIRREMQAKGWTQSRLAHAAGYDERTIRNVLNSQPARFQTVTEICDALGIDAKEVAPTSPPALKVAPERYGSYTEAMCHDYIGSYAAYRRSYSSPNALVRSLFDIFWDAQLDRLRFTENQRYSNGNAEVDHSQAGDIYLSIHTGLLHFETVHQGAVRLITVTRLRKQCFRGVALTQGERECYYQPAVSAMLFRKLLAGADKQHSKQLRVGIVDSGDPEYLGAADELRSIESSVVFFAR